MPSISYPFERVGSAPRGFALPPRPPCVWWAAGPEFQQAFPTDLCLRPGVPFAVRGNRSAPWRFHGGDADKPDFLFDVWSCLLVARSRFRDQTEASCDRPPTKSSRPSQASESARADGPRPDCRGPNQRGDRRIAASCSFDREEVRLLDHVETRSPHSSRGGPASEQGGFLPPDRRAHVRLKTASRAFTTSAAGGPPAAQIPEGNASGDLGPRHLQRLLVEAEVPQVTHVVRRHLGRRHDDLRRNLGLQEVGHPSALRDQPGHVDG